VNRVRWGLSRVLQRWRLDDDAVIEAVLVADELVTNAVRHARTEWRLSVELRGRLLHIAVSDGMVGPDPEPTPGGTRRGLRRVNALATRWGWEEQPWGKTVWAEMLS
jgi:anti-sigma regulatory factor (Ser/Thr protein kinase)